MKKIIALISIVVLLSSTSAIFAKGQVYNSNKKDTTVSMEMSKHYYSDSRTNKLPV